MLLKKLRDCKAIIAGDGTRLRELLHPDRDHPFSGRYSLAHAVVGSAEATKKHRLAAGEVYYIISGRGRMFVDDDIADVTEGDAIEIPPGSIQCIANTGEKNLVFLCIVDPAWRFEDEDVFE